jgi:hypothetical protein
MLPEREAHRVTPLEAHWSEVPATCERWHRQLWKLLDGVRLRYPRLNGGSTGSPRPGRSGSSGGRPTLWTAGNLELVRRKCCDRRLSKGER